MECIVSDTYSMRRISGPTRGQLPPVAAMTSSTLVWPSPIAGTAIESFKQFVSRACARGAHHSFNNLGVLMSSEGLHEPRELLTSLTIATHQAIVSLMEELEAMDWYRQRADACGDAALKAVLVHNMNDEMEHAAMLVEWLRCNVDEFATQLDKFLGSTTPGEQL